MSVVRSRLGPQCLSGRGDKDVEQISQLLPGKWAKKLDWHISSTPGEKAEQQAK